MARLALILAVLSVSSAQAHLTKAKHLTFREIAAFDNREMESLVLKNIDLKEANYERFLDQASVALAEVALVHPRFGEREAALKELRGKVDPDDYNEVIKRAAKHLLENAQSENIAEQATAIVALTNLIVEVRSMKRKELKETLQLIVEAGLNVSDEVRRYAKEPLKNLISPGEEAKAVMATL